MQECDVQNYKVCGVLSINDSFSCVQGVSSGTLSLGAVGTSHQVPTATVLTRAAVLPVLTCTLESQVSPHLPYPYKLQIMFTFDQSFIHWIGSSAPCPTFSFHFSPQDVNMETVEQIVHPVFAPTPAILTNVVKRARSFSLLTLQPLQPPLLLNQRQKYLQ